MKPMITVVTLTYKEFKYIYKTIDSVLEQNYEKIEYIISDDGSNNFPKQEIKEYIQNNKRDNIISFKILTSEVNNGTVKNINKAYKIAQGEILLPLSGDDCFYDSDVITKIVCDFKEKNCDVLVTSRMVVTKDNSQYLIPSKQEQKYIRKLDTHEKQHNSFLTDEFYNMGSGSAMYIKKSYFDKNEYFDEKYVLWEDGPFMTRYTRNRKIETNYSIISIIYRLGGVSNSGENPLMKEDRLRYNKTDRKYEISKKKWLVKEKINYICKRYDCNNKREIVSLYFRYPLVIAFKIFYKLRNL